MVLWKQKWLLICENDFLTTNDIVDLRNRKWLLIYKNDLLTANDTVHLQSATKIGTRLNSSHWFRSLVFYPLVKAIIQLLHHKSKLLNMNQVFDLVFILIKLPIFVTILTIGDSFWTGNCLHQLKDKRHI